MSEFHLGDGKQPIPVYHTSTKSAATILEDMVNPHRTSRSGSSSSLSDTSIHHGYRSGEPRTSTPPYFPILDLPSKDVPSPRIQDNPAPILPVPPNPSTRPHTPPPNEGRGGVRARRETFSSSKKSKNSSSKSFTRRLLEELDSIQHGHSDPRHSRRRRHDEDYAPRGTTPTDSRLPHHHNRSHSRSRSSSGSLSALLVITTERLAQETARANEADRQAAEVLAVFKTTHEAKARLERDMNRVKEELGLYKIQLDLAQKEIFRAQDVVNKLERQRVDAEAEAVRSREKMRTLMETRAVEQALEEGRRLGFEEGLRQGRTIHPAPEMSEPKYNSRRPSSRAEHDRRPAGSRQLESGSSGSSRSSRTHKSIPRSAGLERPISTKPIPQSVPLSPRPRRPSAIAHPHGTPDVARYSDTLPIRTLATPMDVQVPSTQPQPPRPMPPRQPTSALHDHTAKPAEKITVRQSADPNAPIHPIPVQNRSPAVSHRSIVLPPDNYIPILGPDSLISLPPPHELSQPVPPAAPPIPPPNQPTSRPRSNSRAPDVFDNEGGYEARRYADRDGQKGPSRSGRDAGYNSRRYAAAAARSMSVTSPGSTRLSELDLLSPPRNGPPAGGSQGHHGASSRQDTESPTLGRRSRPRAATQPITERIVEEWRHANPEYRTPTPPPASLALSQEEIEVQRPMSADSATSQRIPSSTVYGSRPIRPPRRPREIVMPVPLGGPLLMPNNGLGLDMVALDTANRGDQYAQPTPLSINTPRTTSNTTVPVIDVVTPTDSTRSNMSQRTVVDPVLLTPESANRILLPDYSTHETHVDSSLGVIFSPASTSQTHVGGTLSKNNLPDNFVPLSPIPGMGSLNPYPPGFAPSLPKDHPVGTSPDFRYSASPLMR